MDTAKQTGEPPGKALIIWHSFKVMFFYYRTIHIRIIKSWGGGGGLEREGHRLLSSSSLEPSSIGYSQGHSPIGRTKSLQVTESCTS
jgi:hypothetical protein